MAKVKKAQNGMSYQEEKSAREKIKFRPGQEKRMDRIFESNPDRAIKVGKRMLKRAKAKAEPMMKNGGMKKAQDGKKTAFGMLSVKAGVDKNPNPTAADRIAGAKKMAKFGKKVVKKASYGKMMKGGGKCKNGC